MTALEQLSGEIPVKMDSEERRSAFHKIVAECCEQSSWIALNEAEHLVGLLLSKKYSEGFALPYGGVLDGYRNQGLFLRLLSHAKALSRPLYVDVRHENKSGMAARLVKAGFVEQQYSHHPKQAYFIWSPI
jgi:hypothetical protein